LPEAQAIGSSIKCGLKRDDSETHTSRISAAGYTSDVAKLAEGAGMSEARVGLVIEDDQDIRELVRTVLSQAGFEVTVASSGHEGVMAAKALRPDVITLDLGLPDIDGFEVSRRIREFSDAYIVMLTARADEPDTLIGLESGADDYLTKPFRPRELRARIAAMMRRPRTLPDLQAEGTSAPEKPVDANTRVGAGSGPGPGNRNGSYSHNGLELSYASRSVTVDGEELSLTRTEFELLHALLETGRTVRTKSDLVRRLRDEDYDVGSYISEADERSVEVHMGNLRKKLGDSPQSPRWLQTVRGVGYRLAPLER
jgi:two-component system OmpR family response regulator